MSLNDYSDLEKEVQDAPAPKILEAGTEVKARIIAVRTGVSDKNDARWLQPVFDVPDDPMVIEFNDFIWDPLDNDKLDVKQRERNMYKFGCLCKAFDIDLSRPFSWIDDVPGKEGWLIVGFKKDDEYGDKNTVRKYIMGR